MACLFGARLSAVAEVTLVGAWREGVSAIRRDGLRVEESAGSRRINVRAAFLGESVGSADLVLVLVKSWQTMHIAGFLPMLLKPGGVILTLQNGLGNLELLGPGACPGSTSEGATLLGAGHVRAGGQGPTHAAAPRWVIELLERAGFDARPCERSEAEGLLWAKLTANCGINPLTALLRVPNGALLQCAESMQLMDAATRECFEVAKEKGIVMPFSDPVAHTREIARRTALNHSSMLQDILRGAPTECDAINGAVVLEGRRLGVPTPVNQVLWLLIRAAVAGAMEGTDITHANT
jgi:2-dehydropantoate 2-reductase